MKKTIFALAFIFVISFSNTKADNFRHGVTFNYFYYTLSSYGEWIEIDYNVYVWRPTSVHYRWQPYAIGRWVWSPYGWYWDSYEPFGWATYHYGRWFYDDYYGWVWMPDYEWAPAWVEWRYDDDYIGWAPLPPYATFRIGAGIHFSIEWRSHYNHWHFVNYHNFCSSNVNYYFIDSRHKSRIFNRTKYRTNYSYRDDRIINGGIERDFIERKSGTKILNRDFVNTTVLRDNSGNRNIERDRIEIFRPNDEEVRKYNNIRRDDIQKSNGRTSLKLDKIERRENDNSVRDIKRNDSQKYGKQDEIRLPRDNERRNNPVIEDKNERYTGQSKENKNTKRQEIKVDKKSTGQNNTRTNETQRKSVDIKKKLDTQRETKTKKDDNTTRTKNNVRKNTKERG